MADVGGIAGERLRSFIERIERLEEEKKTLGQDIAEVYAEAKGAGFDTKIMRLLIKERRMDKDDLDEQETLLDIYKRALGMLPLFEAAEKEDAPPEQPAVKPQPARRRPKAKAADKAAERFVEAVAPNPGDRVSLTDSRGNGFSIRNDGGRKIVEPIGTLSEPDGSLAEFEAEGEKAGERESPTTEDCPYGHGTQARAAWERGWARTVRLAIETAG